MFAFKNFLFENLLLEDKIDFILSKQGEKIFKAYEADKGLGKPKLENAEDVLKYMASKFSEKYLQWLVNLYINGQFSLEDHQKINEIITKFEKARPKLEKKDINQYKSIKDIEETLAPLKDDDLKSNRQLNKEREKKFFVDKEAKIFYEGGGIKVIIPKTEAASCYFGVGTKWCTAAEKNNMFNTYSKQGNLYIVLTDDGRKYQFFFKMRIQQMMDEKDQPINNWGELTKKYPALYSAFEKIAQKTGFIPLIKDPSEADYVKAIKYNPQATIKDAAEAKKQLPSAAAEVVFTDKNSVSLIDRYFDAFKTSDLLKYFKNEGSTDARSINYLITGWLKYKKISKEDFNRLLDVLFSRLRNNKYDTALGFIIKKVFENHEFSAYKNIIEELSIETKKELVKYDSDLIEYFENDLPEDFKIDLIKANDSVFKKFENPTNKMKENYRWVMQAKDSRYKRGY
jgi:hypothetical protein